MVNEFLVRVEEEAPSDERYAVTHLETVVGGEYVEKLASLVARMEKISLTANVEIMTEIKNILADILASMVENEKKYSTMIESMLHGTPDMSEIEGKLTTLEKGYMSLSEMYVGIAEALNKLEERLGDISVGTSEYENKMDERLSNINNSNTDVADKVEEIKNIEAINSDVMRDMSENISSLDRRNSGILIELEKYGNELAEIKSRLHAKKVPRTRKTSARRTRVPRRAIEDEALDILIMNTLKNVSMNIASLKRSTNIGEKRLRDRLEVLMSRGVVMRERKGRSIFYISRVDETTEIDNG